MSWFTRKNQKGFTLIELLLALAILGVVTYFIVSLTSSVRHGGKVGETKQRMEIISAKMKEYYRHQGVMPEYPTGRPNEVPVDALNLEAKFRFDGWGQPIFYHYYNDGTNYDPKVINEVEVDNVSNMAGYLLSYGGNQDQDVTLDDDDNTAESGGDDILMAINVNREAMEIALDEVRELQRRVNQFDNLFTGSDMCGVAGDPANHSDCQPGGDLNWPLEDNGGANPNCGTASLDQIESVWDGTGSGNYGCDTTWYSSIGRDSDFSSTNDDATLKFIVGYYALGNNYLLDPWGNPYQWGCGLTACDTTYNTDNNRYRKFFSQGPDGSSDTNDDIIP